MQLAQDISSRMYVKKRRRSGLRRGFLTCIIGEIDKSRCVSYFSTDPKVKVGGKDIFSMNDSRLTVFRLDTQNSREVIALLKEASRKYEQTIIMITHSRSNAQSADRILQVSDGILTDLG